ncbi:MAG: radical SAM protein [Candidatus Erginobacter occultus]|nr:radical SAM protein [Candidatus Erginobacter occultus]
MIAKLVRLINRGDLPPRRAAGLLGRLPGYLFHRALGDGRSGRPFLITIELTYRCNLSCPYCYLAGLPPVEETVSEEEIDRLLADLPRPRPLVHLTGGEPFLRADLAAIVSRVRSRGCWTSVSTNGTLISSRAGDWLESGGPDRLTISLNGPEEIHDAVTSRPGAFAEAMAGIDRLGSWGMLNRVAVNCLLHPRNLPILSEFAVRLGRMGITRVSFQHPMGPQLRSRPGEGGIGPGSAMDPGRVNGALDSLRRVAGEKRIKVRFIPELTPGEIARWYSEGYSRPCRYPYFALRIDPRGRIYPCPGFPAPFGDIRLQALGGIWNGPAYRRFRRGLDTLPRPAACRNCCKI